MFNVNSKDTRTTSLASFFCLYCYLWIYSKPFSSTFIADFEYVIVCLIMIKCEYFKSFQKRMVLLQYATEIFNFYRQKSLKLIELFHQPLGKVCLNQELKILIIYKMFLNFPYRFSWHRKYICRTKCLQRSSRKV